MSKKRNKNVPELRFPDFSQSWLIKSVSELVKENFIYKPLDGNHGNLHPTSSDYVKSGIPFVMSNDIQDGVINYSKCHHISEDLARSLQKGFSKEGDVLLTHKGTVGEVAVVGKTTFPFIMLTPQVTYYRVKNPKLLSNLFLASLFASYNFQRMLKVFAAGGTRPYIGITEQGKLTVSVPPLKEQEKIASFFGAVDRRLTQLRRKQELLQTYKRGVMQKIFSQQIRFTQPDGSPFPDWETDRIDNFLVRYIDPVDVQSDTKYKQIGIRSHGKGIFHKDPVTGKALGNKRVYWVHPKSFVVNIVFAWEQAVALTSSEEEDFIASHRFLMFLPKKNRVNLEFILLFFLGSRGKSLLELASPGGAGRNKTLGQQNFSELKITLPKVEEQEKIANLLAAIDRKIETLSCQIDQTEQFKKGLLQKMFV